jgi:ABC-type branched-subunit amino acid transport system ATPase component
VTAPLLRVEGLVKRYTRGLVRPRTTFTLEADFTVDGPGIVGVMGPNGSGKTTLFELITGSNRPTAGHVRVGGQDIHAVRYGERDRLAIHYHQSYQVRAFRRTRPVIAATVYHNADGIWKTPLWLMENLRDYRILFRTHSWCGTGAVVYAIPDEKTNM